MKVLTITKLQKNGVVNRSMLYFVRHGQTDANLNNIHCGGEWDLPLNETGKNQARVFGEQQKEVMGSFDAVFVSPMARAQETARLITQNRYEFNVIPDLREWELGNDSGKPINEERPPFLESLRTPLNGESFEAFQTRCLVAMRTVAQKMTGKCLIVAHGGVWASYAHYVRHPVIHLANCTMETIDIKKLA